MTVSYETNTEACSFSSSRKHLGRCDTSLTSQVSWQSQKTQNLPVSYYDTMTWQINSGLKGPYYEKVTFNSLICLFAVREMTACPFLKRLFVFMSLRWNKTLGFCSTFYVTRWAYYLSHASLDFSFLKMWARCHLCELQFQFQESGLSQGGAGWAEWKETGFVRPVQHQLGFFLIYFLFCLVYCWKRTNKIHSLNLEMAKMGETSERRWRWKHKKWIAAWDGVKLMWAFGRGEMFSVFILLLNKVG